MERGEEHDIKHSRRRCSALSRVSTECHSCSAVHFTSHAVQYGLLLAGYSRPIVQAEPYAWRVVDVLRVHARRFYSAKVLDLFIRNYCKEFCSIQRGYRYRCYHSSPKPSTGTTSMTGPSEGRTLRMLLFGARKSRVTR